MSECLHLALHTVFIIQIDMPCKLGILIAPMSLFFPQDPNNADLDKQNKMQISSGV